MGIFGPSPQQVAAVLLRVRAPAILIVGGLDAGVIELNQEAYRQLAGTNDFSIVPGATHLFEEPWTMEAVADLAAAWFRRYLAGLR